MTNTGDFRRYSYGSDAAYAVQAFNYQRTSAAPAYIPKPEKEFKVRQRGFLPFFIPMQKQMNLPLRFQGLKKIILPLKVKIHVLTVNLTALCQ